MNTQLIDLAMISARIIYTARVLNIDINVVVRLLNNSREYNICNLSSAG